MTVRPPIPEDVKRRVRQRNGFGCCICGSQPFQYEHIEPWAEVQHHDEPNLTLLCLPHHDAVTGRNPRMSKTTVKRHAANPLNSRKKYTTASRLFFPQEGQYTVKIGNDEFEYITTEGYEYSIISIDGINVISFRRESDAILLNANFYDCERNLIAIIRDGEFESSVDVWDWELVGQRLLVRSALRSIELDVQLNPSLFSINRAHLFGPMGTRVTIERDSALGQSSDSALIGRHFRNQCAHFSPFGVSFDPLNKDGFVSSAHAMMIAEKLFEFVKADPTQTSINYLLRTLNKVLTTAALADQVEIYYFSILVYSFLIKHISTIEQVTQPRVYFNLGHSVIQFHRLCGHKTTKGAQKFLEKALSFSEDIYGGGYRATAKYMTAICLLESYYKHNSMHDVQRARDLAQQVVVHYGQMLESREYEQDFGFHRAAVYLLDLCDRPRLNWKEASSGIAFNL